MSGEVFGNFLLFGDDEDGFMILLSRGYPNAMFFVGVLRAYDVIGELESMAVNEGFRIEYNILVLSFNHSVIS